MGGEGMSLRLPLKYALIDTYFLTGNTVKVVIPVYISSGYGTDTYARVSIGIGSNVYHADIGKVGANSTVETVVDVEIPNFGAGTSAPVVKDATVCLEAYSDAGYTNLLGKCCKPMKIVFLDTNNFINNAIIKADPDLGKQNVDMNGVSTETELVLDGNASYTIECSPYNDTYIKSTYDHTIPSGKVGIVSMAIYKNENVDVYVLPSAMGSLSDDLASYAYKKWVVVSVILDSGTYLRDMYFVRVPVGYAKPRVVIVDRLIVIEVDKSTIGL